MNELKKGIQDLKAVLNLDPKNKPAKRLARTFIERYNKTRDQTIGKGKKNETTKKKTTTTTSSSFSKKKDTGLGLYDDKLDSGVSEHVRRVCAL